MKTTFSRTFVTFAVILLATLLLVGISFQLLIRGYLTKKAIEGLKNDSTALAQAAAACDRDHTLTDHDFLVILSVVTDVSDADIVVCDQDGRLQLCSDAPLGCAHQGMYISNDRYLQQVHSQTHVVTTGQIPGLYNDQRYVVATAVRDSITNQVTGIIIVSTPVADTHLVLKRISDTYIFVSILVILVAVLALSYYTRRSSSPLRDMAKTATAFGHGDLKARAEVPKQAPQEILDLALAFNNMAQSLEQSEYQRKEFVANVSHELKTPMTTIGGYVDGILDGTISPSQQEHYLTIVSDEIKRLSRLVRSMLDISQLQEQGQIPEEKKTIFDITECAGLVLITFEQAINAKQLEVDVDMPELPVRTLACRDYITQVLYNLLDNSVKFCPEGGKLGLQILPDTEKIFVTVSNNGPMIPPEELPLLFDRFHKLDKSRSQNRDGWGLGLYIVKTLVCSHGEDISVSSTEEQTRFTFTLPIAN